jgi:hypothetical protein
VNRLGDQLLAGTRFTRDQHGRQRGRRLLDDAVDRANARAVPHDSAERPRLAKLPAQVPDLTKRVLALDGLPQQDLQPLRVHRLAQIVVGSLFDSLNGRLDGALGGQENEGQVRKLILQRPEHLHPANSRHDHVADDDRGPKARDLAQPLFTIRGFLGLKAPGLHQFREALSGGLIVLHD